MLCKSQSDGMKKLMYLCGRVHFLPCFSTPGFELHKKELTLFTIGITVGFCAVSVRANWNVVLPYPETTSPPNNDVKIIMQPDPELKVLKLSDVLQFGKVWTWQWASWTKNKCKYMFPYTYYYCSKQEAYL